ncbi:transposase [Streptomyces sp. NRRL F-5123]|uniref:transposase n=1 Tax=Streptomyces sp. NRRL F-5123 TaxID=1463856 RepID=UPI00227999AB|nr:transposase [Streptomyces sp. NRRL F-5123]
MLVDRARSEGLQLTGEGGLLQQLTKRVLESALEGEITDHLGYDKHDAEGRGSSNSRNGTRAKTVLTDVGPVDVRVPRDVAGTFEPQIVKKRQRRLTGVDEMVLSLSARGLTHGDISAHLAEVYGANVSKQTISTITDKVMDGMAEWQNWPLDPGRFRSVVANYLVNGSMSHSCMAWAGVLSPSTMRGRRLS